MTTSSPSPADSIAARIREARRAVGLTQRELAGLVGVASNTVWAWEAGRVRPTHEHLVEVARHCRTGVHELEGREWVYSELRREAEVSFRDAVDSLPEEDIEAIGEFIRFVRARRRGQRRRRR
ncbi:MAG: helix-turn-helix transcriptional regulator [Chloroflexi bacterium]|nr:helix-turn-helix transcriptional regulator [Chloroflexota bacterium]